MPFTPQEHAFVRPPELDDAGRTRHPVVIIGAGPVGLALAIDLARRGVRVIVIERGNTVGVGSKAICWSKRTLEIMDRLGCGRRMKDKGVVWNVGKVFVGAGTEPLYEFDLLPEPDHHFPAFVNLQQYYVNEWLIERCGELDNVDIRWQSTLAALDERDDAVTVTIDTPEGSYALQAEFVVAADGCRSKVRDLKGLEFVGKRFEDNFLIIDVTMKRAFPSERWFWFDPEFNPGQSALLHKQPDDLWRLDFQLGWDIDREAEMDPRNAERRVRAMLGPDVDFEIEWISVYTFECRRLERFVHDRVIFIGDAAHLVSPFGARGANGGIQDAENLAWKLAAVLTGRAPRDLLQTYDAERIAAADENILNSSRATDFMTPKTPASHTIRASVFELARHDAAARAMINSGRLSTPCSYIGSPLSTEDRGFETGPAPGAPAIDAPVRTSEGDDWLLRRLGQDFTLLYFGEPDDLDGVVKALDARIVVVAEAARAAAGSSDIVLSDIAASRYGARRGTTYLIRPDHHVAARWRDWPGAGAVIEALTRASGGRLPEAMNVTSDDAFAHSDAVYAAYVAAHERLGDDRERLAFDAMAVLRLAARADAAAELIDSLPPPRA